MRKIMFAILIILFPGSLFASEMNNLLEQNYKITRTELVKFETEAYKIFTLRKGSNIFICSLQIEDLTGLGISECEKP